MSRQNILAIILVLSLIAGGYVWYSYLYPRQNNKSAGTEERIVSPEFLAKTELLSRLKIDIDFFKNAAFSALESGPPLPAIPAEINGRANPFAQF